MRERIPQLKVLGLWFGGNAMTALGIAIPLAASTEFPFGQMLMVTAIAAYSIGGAATWIGSRYSARINADPALLPLSFWLQLILRVSVGVVFADIVCFLLYSQLLSPKLFTLLWERLGAFAGLSLLLSAVVAPAATFFELQVKYSKRLKARAAKQRGAAASVEAQPKEHSAPASQTSGRSQFLVVRVREGSMRIPTDEISYLSAAGRKTIIHTDKGDHEVNTYIGDLAEQLPAWFATVHRSFVVNAHRVRLLENPEGGTSRAVLHDGDDTAVPVSRRRLRHLRDLLGELP